MGYTLGEEKGGLGNGCGGGRGFVNLMCFVFEKHVIDRMMDERWCDGGTCMWDGTGVHNGAKWRPLRCRP